MTPILDEGHAALLRAVTCGGEDALRSFRTWRAATAFNDIDAAAYRVMPLLVDLARRHAIDDPDIARMKGVVRHIWATNVVRLRQLFAALHALQGAGIQPMLLKGAALLARCPEIAAKRTFADYDILVPPAAIGAARRALEHAGFAPKGFKWDDLENELTASVTAGAPLSMPGQASEIDLHWRPVSNIYDSALTDRVFAAAERSALQNEPVFVPSISHHLFFAIARSEPWDKIECFNRLLEGYFLLTHRAAGLDLTEFAALIERYGLEAAAHAYFATLRATAGVSIPNEIDNRFADRISKDKAREWALLATPPSHRSPLQSRFLERQSVNHGRTSATWGIISWTEAALMQTCARLPSMWAIWQLARRRFRGPSTGQPRFLSGFSYPEAEGRWTLGHWAFIAMPLTDEQKQGAPLRLNAAVYRGRRSQIKVVATAGDGICHCVVDEDNKTDTPDLSLRAAPQLRLGGDALVLLWLPDAISPLEAGESQDQRVLGLFLQKNWWL